MKSSVPSNAHGNPSKIPALACGRLFRLTLEERVKLDIRTMRAADVTKDEADAFYRKRKLERDRQRQQRKRDELRARKAAGMDLDERDEAVFLVMGNEWRTVGELNQVIVRTRPDGRRLPKESQRRAIRRSIDVLHAKRLIVAETVIGSRGQPVLRVQRKLKLIDKRRDFVTGTPGHRDKKSSTRRR